MDTSSLPGGRLPRFNDEWSAERLYRTMLLPYGVAGRSREELRTCPHCARTYYRSNGGACPRCSGPVDGEPRRNITLPFGIG